jgi:hypothetical protein
VGVVEGVGQVQQGQALQVAPGSKWVLSSLNLSLYLSYPKPLVKTFATEIRNFDFTCTLMYQFHNNST